MNFLTEELTELAFASCLPEGVKCELVRIGERVVDIREAYEFYRHHHEKFAKMRHEILSKAIPSYIVKENPMTITPKYSEPVEHALKEIDRMEESFFKDYEVKPLSPK